MADLIELNSGVIIDRSSIRFIQKSSTDPDKYNIIFESPGDLLYVVTPLTEKDKVAILNG